MVFPAFPIGPSEKIDSQITFSDWQMREGMNIDNI